LFEHFDVKGVVTNVTVIDRSAERDVILIERDARSSLIAKLAAPANAGPLEAEAAGLRELYETNTVLTPVVHAIGRRGSDVALIMDAIPTARATGAHWISLGHDLAALHAVDVGERYGFHHDNFCGPSPQSNVWCDDWVTFNREHRLRPQVDRAARTGQLSDDEAQRVRDLVDDLDRFIPSRPTPALLHGDLWSGNAIPTADDRVALIDPACSIGDRWADVAMMELFGGFSSACRSAYEARHAAPSDVDQRLAIYQLYHVLNHANLFGRGYVGRAMSLVDGLRRRR